MSLFVSTKNYIIRKIAKKSIYADHQRLIYTFLTITMAITLIMFFSNTLFSTQNKLKNQAKDMPHLTIYHSDFTTYQKLKSDDNVEKIIVQHYFSPISMGDSLTLQTIFCNAPNQFPNVSLDGKLPEKSDEIAISADSVKNLQKDLKINDNIILNLGNGNLEYKITGIISSPSHEPNTITIYCSQEYLSSVNPANKGECTLFLYLKNSVNLNITRAEEIIELLISKYNLSSSNVLLNSHYFTLTGQNISLKSLLEFIFIATFIILSASIVVYNIFFISINRKIKEYGQLRTIGMTSLQLQKLIICEGKRIAVPSIISGIIIGAFFSYILQPSSWYIQGFINSSIISLLFGLFIIGISIYTPAKMTKRISPIESLKYEGYTLVSPPSHKKNYKITPFRLAILNLQRNKKKVILTIVSLSLCGILLISAASVKKSFSEINMARSNEFQYGDFKLEFTGDSIDLNLLDNTAQLYGQGALQSNSKVFSTDLEHKLLSIKGVNQIKKWYGTTGIFEVQEQNNNQTTVFAYTNNEIPKLESRLVEGTVEPQKLIKNNGIIVNIAENIPEEVYHWNPTLGDQVSISFWNIHGEPVKETFTVMGITNGLDGYSQIFRLPLHKLESITGYDVTTDWELITDSKNNTEIEIALNSIVSTIPDLSLYTLNDYINSLSLQYQGGFFIVYVFVIFLSAFGLINLVNLTVTNQIIRRKEIGIMLAVGLTQKQLWKSRIFEGGIIIIISLVTASLIGIPIGYISTTVFKITGAVEQYSFPYVEYEFFILLLLLAEFLLEIILSFSLKKYSLVKLIETS